MKPLDFLVIGSQKCATTWLHSCLVEHPELFLPLRKREVEYLGGDLFETHGLEWYFSMFNAAQQGQKKGDVSVEYFFDPRSPEVVAQYLPDIKLIVSLRDPIDRAISAFYWYLRKGKIPQLDLIDGLSLALDLVGSEDLSSAKGEDYLVDILKRGFYDEQLERYLRYFRSDQFLVVFYEDIDLYPEVILKEIYTYLGVNSQFIPTVISSQPKQNTYYKPLIALQRIAPKSIIWGKTLDLLNQVMNRNGLGRKKPELSEDLRKKLNQFYEPHNKRLQEVIANIPQEQRPHLGKMSWIV